MNDEKETDKVLNALASDLGVPVRMLKGPTEGLKWADIEDEPKQKSHNKENIVGGRKYPVNEDLIKGMRGSKAHLWTALFEQKPTPKDNCKIDEVSLLERGFIKVGDNIAKVIDGKVVTDPFVNGLIPECAVIDDPVSSPPATSDEISALYEDVKVTLKLTGIETRILGPTEEKQKEAENFFRCIAVKKKDENSEMIARDEPEADVTVLPGVIHNVTIKGTFQLPPEPKKSLTNYLRDYEKPKGKLYTEPLPLAATKQYDLSLKYNPLVEKV